jgi:hypothetical protein
MSPVAHLTEEEMRRAWAEYATSLQGLEGLEYELAEQEAWERLQDLLGSADDTEPPLTPPGV